ICLEDRKTPLDDGTKKIIINANAFKKAKDKNLSRFLEYVKTGKVSDEFTGRIEKMIEQVKNTEQARSEYRFMSAFEMDARRAGRQEGLQAGIAQGLLQGRSEGMQAGIAQGFSDGVRETAKVLKRLGDSVQKIMQATGLTKEEIEKL
uniref:Rpn family recombination-promoting nuclease/putative transposase n=1 Tax=Treponema pedis TaxID=409322 RepID=UPI000493EF95